MVLSIVFFFFNDTATTEIYTLSLHDALPISPAAPARRRRSGTAAPPTYRPSRPRPATAVIDRKSTRLNSSHANISYAVFCLKKKKKNKHSETHESTLCNKHCRSDNG